MKKFNKIMSTFTKTIAKLEALEVESLEKAATLTSKTAVVQDKAVAAVEKIYTVANGVIDILDTKACNSKEEAAAAFTMAAKMRSFLEV